MRVIVSSRTAICIAHCESGGAMSQVLIHQVLIATCEKVSVPRTNIWFGHLSILGQCSAENNWNAVVTHNRSSSENSSALCWRDVGTSCLARIRQETRHGRQRDCKQDSPLNSHHLSHSCTIIHDFMIHHEALYVRPSVYQKK